MAALQCEICGGKLVGRPGGLFECEYCGMQYDTAWAKEKIQEIKGTVKVEGTVEVTGTVKVEGATSAENFIRLGFMAIEDEKDDEAIAHFDKALAINAKCAEAYWGKFLVEWTPNDCTGNRCMELLEAMVSSKDLARARKYANAELLGQIEALEESLRLEHQAWLDELKEKGKVLEIAHNRAKKLCPFFLISSSSICTLNADATVNAVSWHTKIDYSETKQWKGISQIACGSDHVVGLRWDGTVVAAGSNQYGQCNVSRWKDIVTIYACADQTFGLKSDGTVEATGDNRYGQCNVWSWTNIKKIETAGNCTIGLKSDGSVVVTGKMDEALQEVQKWTDVEDIVCYYHLSTFVCCALTRKGKVLRSNKRVDKHDWHYYKRQSNSKQYWLPSCMDTDSDYGRPFEQCIAIAGGFGLRPNGTVDVAGGSSRYELEGWLEKQNDIVSISGDYNIAFLKADGYVVAYSYNRDSWPEHYSPVAVVSTWKNVVAIFTYYDTIIGIQDNGRVLIYTDKENFRTVQNWKVCNHIDTYEQERQQAKETFFREQEEERQRLEQEKLAKLARKAELEKEKNGLEKELSELKGLFFAIQRKKIQIRLEEINNELRSLQYKLL